MRTTLIRVGAVTAGALLSAVTVAGPALAASDSGAVTANPTGWGAGYNTVINGHAAAAWVMKVEGGDTVEVFCADEPAAYDSNPSTKYTTATWSGSGRPSLGKAADIAANAAAKGTPLSDKNAEYAARQLAIWKYTNNLDYSSVNNTAIRGRADALVAAANALPERPSSAVLTVSSSPSQVKNLVKVHMATAAGDPLANQMVNLDANGIKQTVKTDAKGDAETTYTAESKPVSMAASWTGVLPAGSILVPATVGAQKVITTKDVAITRTGSATLAGFPVADPTPSAAPSKAPTTAPTTAPAAKPNGPQELPYTGTWVTLPIVAVAGALAAAGYWLRRRSA